MSNIRRPDDKMVADALREVNKKLDDVIRRLAIIEIKVTNIETRLNTGDVDFT